MINTLKEPPIFSVSEISTTLKNYVENTFSFVRVKGEISGLKIHTSGHVYFSLKDENSLIDGICWKGVASALSLKLQDGLEVVCSGRITTYPARSKYQIIVDKVDLAGVGALMKLLQERKEKLANEGLFSPQHKKPLPFLPKTIGVVTSPTGAVIRDILHRLNDRFPCSVILWPVAVQGPTAAEGIAHAIRGFNKFPNKPDLLIVARGGGSLEDLWCFNEEIVVRAVFDSKIPVISAVGHETDVTLIDFVADQRAPTPTAAAELSVPVKNDLMLFVQNSSLQLHHGLRRLLKEYSTRIDLLKRGLGNPQKIIDEKLLYLDEKIERFLRSFKSYIEQKNNTFLRLHQLLESYSYQNTLKRGFSLVKTPLGSLVTSSEQARSKDLLHVVFHDGTCQVKPLEE